MAVDDHLLIENATIAAELALPKGVTHHVDRRRQIVAESWPTNRPQPEKESSASPAKQGEPRARDVRAGWASIVIIIGVILTIGWSGALLWLLINFLLSLLR